MTHCKYALDKLFLFTICLSLAIFSLNLATQLDSSVLYALHILNALLLLGYALFFARDLYLARNKIAYCKEHWMLIVLLALPMLPVSLLIPAQETVSISQNIAWYLFDEAGML